MTQQQAARAFLDAVARGEARDELLDALIESALADECVRLAVEARSGGEHRWRKAIELAGAILRGGERDCADSRSDALSPTERVVR